ncbi:MAG: aspartate-semialdehyde dehydrogenase [Bacteroidales bacterium]|nr:aspartate-semialdehyde dehydrogenase [Bacteroidales bacterium]MDY0215654.1 aspartate-semialdehyde dehydrogenase [Bacteroidales bacterium]
MKIAVVGVSGMVGTVMLEVLEERGYSDCEIIAVASERSVGQKLSFAGRELTIISLTEAVSKKPDFALFSAGSSVSLEWAPKFAENGCWVIDNSSAWRMNKSVPLIVPEVNPNHIDGDSRIIANPNCSTTQLVMALAPLHAKYKIKRLVISTYQSVTGTGVKAIRQLENERKGISGEMVYHYPIDMNVIPHGGDFLADGYTTEEIKLLEETRKILGDSTINVTSTVVRVPVAGGHSESVNIEFNNDIELKEIIEILEKTEGLVVLNNAERFEYPMPLYAKNRDEVFVGRIRRDFSQPNSLNMWIVADNVRKGAATNAVQILDLLRQKF